MSRQIDPGDVPIAETGTYCVVRISWRPSGDDLAALRARGSDDWEDETHVLLAWEDLGAASPPQHRFDPKTIDAFPDTLRIVGYRTPKWSDDGNRLFFGVQERDSATTGPNGPGTKAPGTAKSGSTAADSTAGSSAEDYDPADVQVWHSSDVDIIPRQEVQAKQDRRDNYLAAWHLTASDTESPWTRLGTELTEDVEILEGGDQAAGLDQTSYRQERMFGPEYYDLYVIDVATGERESGRSPSRRRNSSNFLPTGRVSTSPERVARDPHPISAPPGWTFAGESSALFRPLDGR